MNKTDGSPFTLTEVIEIMERAVDGRRSELTAKGGMHVPYHGPLCNAKPSVLRDVERWISMLKNIQPTRKTPPMPAEPMNQCECGRSVDGHTHWRQS